VVRRHPRMLLRALVAFPKAVYFATLVQAQQIAHVHANWATHPAMSALVIARLTGVPWSFTGHASDIYLHTTMLAEKIQAAKFVITCTRYNRDYLTRIAGEATASKIIVSYHGVDLKVSTSPEGVTVLSSSWRWELSCRAGLFRPHRGLQDLVDRGLAFD
jgi:hypothetical protein